MEQAGYFVGMTGKGWGPGNWKISGRTRNPAGPDFRKRKTKPAAGGNQRKRLRGEVWETYERYSPIRQFPAPTD